jgi:TolA-binding protein
MAQRKQDLLGNVIGKITELPGAKGLIDSMQSLGERLDDMQKRVRGLEQMEKRLSDLEQRVETLEGGGTAKRARPTAKKTTSTRSSATPTGTATRRRTPPKQTPDAGA